MIFHSIRWRLQLWYGVLLCIVLAGFGVTAHQLQRRGEMRRVDQELQLRIVPLLESIRRPPPGERGGPPGGPGGPLEGRGRRGPPPREGGDGLPPMPRDFRLNPNRAQLFAGETNAFYYIVWTREERELSRSSSAPMSVPLPGRIKGGLMMASARTRAGLREFYQFTPPGECILVGRSIEPEMATLQQFAYGLSGLGAGVLILGLAGGWWVATRAIQPIHDISAGATRIAAGDLSHRINTQETDNELGQLAKVLNSTFDRLQSAFDRQRAFTADASHELRTPVAVILAQTQATLARDRNPEEYRQTLEACQRAALRMRSLTESLLALARLDAGHETLHRESIDLARIAEQTVDLLRPMAESRSVTVHCDLMPTGCKGDAERIAQVVTNLLSNAVAHNQQGGEVFLSTCMENGAAILSVRDTGPGIPSAEMPKLFERFYRGDASRTTSTGGTGLGLAISKAITDAHGGSLSASSTEGEGTTFTLRLPHT